jgi:ribosome maturation factor RimP
MQGYETVEADIRELIEEYNPEIFIVDIKLSVSSKSVLSILLDTDDGIGIGDIAGVSRKLNHYFEEEGDPFPFAFNLEVGSPGVGNPFKVRRQYPRNVGRKLKVTLLDGDQVQGKLREVHEDHIVLELPPQKKKKKQASAPAEADETEKIINFDSIKEAKVEISFD